MQLNLTEDEALVMFELLARLDESDAFPCEDSAELRVLWSLQGQLEKAMVEPLRPDYRELVQQARARLNAKVEA